LHYQKKDFIIHAVLVIVLAAALILGYLWVRREKAPAGGDTIAVTIEVIHGDGKSRTAELDTDEEYLGPALLEAGLAEGGQRQYGLYIETVDGETADESLEQWWCITKGNEPVLSGADAIPIADGEQYELTLKTGW